MGFKIEKEKLSAPTVAMFHVSGEAGLCGPTATEPAQWSVDHERIGRKPSGLFVLTAAELKNVSDILQRLPEGISGMKEILFDVRSGSPLGIGRDGIGRLLRI